MTPKRPPRIATWMLKHFGCGPNINVILGDLEEQYQLNDGALRYWRQALLAIPVGHFKELRNHAWNAAASVMTGWALWYLCVVTIFPGLSNFLFGSGLRPEIELSHPIGSAWTILWTPIKLPVVINQPFLYAYSVLMPLIAWAICARMVRIVGGIDFDRTEDRTRKWARLAVRIHRDRQTSVVLLFAASTLLLNLLVIGPFIFELQHLPQGLHAELLYSYVGYFVMSIIASILGILIGGGLLRDQSAVASS